MLSYIGIHININVLVFATRKVYQRKVKLQRWKQLVGGWCGEKVGDHDEVVAATGQVDGWVPKLGDIFMIFVVVIIYVLI